VTIGETGEHALIARLASRFPHSADVVVGPGDDAAVVAAPGGAVVATTDTLVQDVHFRLDWSSPREIGRKAAAASLADLAAMGARPTALLVGLAAPGSLPLAVADGIADGLAEECALAGTTVAGGDVVAGPVLTLAVTGLGALDGREPVLLGGARPGDLVVLAGSLGESAAGLAVLRAGRTGHDDLVAAHRAPRVPYGAGPDLAALGATAMTDVSDGLASDLGLIAERSGVGIELDDLPLLAEAARDLGADPLDWALYGGEDHCLVATVEAAGGYRVIGRVVAGSGLRYRGGPVVPRGYEHFGGTP
jgi:thiamine-monophosphate kinase